MTVKPDTSPASTSSFGHMSFPSLGCSPFYADIIQTCTSAAPSLYSPKTIWIAPIMSPNQRTLENKRQATKKNAERKATKKKAKRKITKKEARRKAAKKEAKRKAIKKEPRRNDIEDVGKDKATKKKKSKKSATKKKKSKKSAKKKTKTTRE
ncbi:hypothetical protein JYT83_01310 [bacterium AH-315-F18]|nr:hypothetical protein [bacterium AH-315-F18]